MLLLEVKDLRCSLRNTSIASVRPRKIEVLKGISFRMEKGDSLGLVGESGSGKTTLARCLAGLLQPNSGIMSFDGLGIFPEVNNRKSVGLEIQMLFQGNGLSLDPVMNVFEILKEGIIAREKGLPGERIIERAKRFLQAVGLPTKILYDRPGQLSGGQRQRVALARVLAVKPHLLILDEPTSALDALTSVQLLRMLKGLQGTYDMAFLLITHDVRAALSFCNRIAVLRNGIIIEEGTAKEIAEEPKHEYTRNLWQNSQITQAPTHSNRSEYH
jgi:ABC-type glutathione transport system ATPase component